MEYERLHYMPNRGPRWMLIFLSLILIAMDNSKNPNISASDAVHPWIGTWTTIDKEPENMGVIVEAMGVSADKFGGKVNATWKFSKEGNGYHAEISIPSQNYQKSWSFKLDQELISELPSGPVKYTFSENDEKHLVMRWNVQATNKLIQCIFTVNANGTELFQHYTVDEHVGKRWFKNKL